jgi:taurine--2-oxoglutarate transaminase
MGIDHTHLSIDHDDLARRYREHVLVPWSKQSGIEPLMIKDAKGVYLTLADGRRLIDMKSQSFTANLGHAHAGMQEALIDAARNGQVLASEVFSPERLKLAENLKRISPHSEDVNRSKVFFTLGGAEANENAIKMARMYTKRHKIITRYRSYHGATLATINFSGDYRRIPVDNAVTGIVRFPDPYPRGSGQIIDTVRLLEEIIEIEGPETIAAIMLEGITGANGVFIPESDYWPRIRALCDRFGIVLIADEVLSGFCRTGPWFGIDHFNVVPDMITMSKGITAGYAPLGAVVVSQPIAHAFDDEPLWCGLTQYGHPWCCSVANAAIHFYEHDHIRENVSARGEELRAMLATLAHDHAIVAETRSIGLLAAIDLRKSADDESPLVRYRAHGDELKPALLLQSLLKQHGVTALVRFGMIVLAPPLTISRDELSEGLTGVSQALTAFAQQNVFAYEGGYSA